MLFNASGAFGTVTVAIAILSISLLGCKRDGDSKNTITIAAVGPLTGSAAARGKDLENGVRMAVDEANAAGGVDGHKIVLNLYDDGDKPSKAQELARQIAATHAVAVLGQVASQAAVAAGPVYREQHIPAITGAASESKVTRGNEWFFRLLPDAAGQGRFLADYAHYRMEARRIAVIREKGTAGEEFASSLRDRAREHRIQIASDLEFASADAKNPATFSDLAAKLAKSPKPDIIVLGLQFGNTAALLRTLHDNLGAFAAMGYSSAATEALSAQLASKYTEGMIVAAPQLPDVAEYPQTVFASRFKARYGKDPNPESVRWFESARLVFRAIQDKHLKGVDLSGDRSIIRDWLASLNSADKAAEGVGGPIYFDSNRNVERTLSVGQFYDGHLISAPVQFTPVADPATVPGWDRLSNSGLVVDDDGAKFVKTPVVYAGIDLNTLDNIDVRTSSFSADFFLWFRSQEGLEVDPHEVEFPTVISGGQLGQQVLSRTRGGFTTVTYHVKGVFRGEYEFARFPFDHQTLRIPIQFRNSTSYSMILAYGDTGSPKASLAGTTPAKSPLASKLWRLKDQLYYRDVVAYDSSFGERENASQRTGVQFNRINAQIVIERDVFGYAVKNFLPLACILVAVLIGYALAADVINPRVSIGVTALLTTSVLYQKMASELPTVTYIIAIDYVFFAFFAFCVTFLALTVVTYETQKAKLKGPTRNLNVAGAVLTMVGLAATLGFVWVRYWGPA